MRTLEVLALALVGVLGLGLSQFLWGAVAAFRGDPSSAVGHLGLGLAAALLARVVHHFGKRARRSLPSDLR